MAHDSLLCAQMRAARARGGGYNHLVTQLVSQSSQLSHSTNKSNSRLLGFFKPSQNTNVLRVHRAQHGVTELPAQLASVA